MQPCRAVPADEPRRLGFEPFLRFIFVSEMVSTKFDTQCGSLLNGTVTLLPLVFAAS